MATSSTDTCTAVSGDEDEQSVQGKDSSPTATQQRRELLGAQLSTTSKKN